MQVYLDYAASTPLKKEVLDEMLPYMTQTFGNASSIHAFGRNMHKGLDQSRRNLAKLIGASYDEFYFTGGGTESDNWALKGIAESYSDKGKHIIISEFEHPAVLNAAKALEKKGYEVTYIKPDSQGHIKPEDVKKAIKKDTILVSIMFVNNEIGTIQDVKTIGSICRENDVIFHTDAVQAFGYLDIDVKEMNIDMMSLSAHKIYGPIGIGGLYIRKGIKIKPIIDGGAQERKRRAGTSNVSGAVGFSKAASIRYDDLENITFELKKKRDYLYEGLKDLDIRLNGSENRHPGSLNILFNHVKGDTLLMNLDLAGIAVSSGSACSSGSVNPSHVLLSIGLSTQEAKASLRMTVGDSTSYEELDYVIEKMTEIITRLR
ncbi:cysteine desulfurase [Acidaminobacter sp. JC074]|uniref:cysteine desulfurase family protein n=1 Tax=Acidaminobacter sp. JC074 TaxID=2530199 RepID=UPI001F10FDB0|nr:cysteine desulfurase family protein [Acidaminobacter sp. JC074]MCH4888547.1 cysteine desulfurase [Acidaminobacter sp. JC074]